MRLYLFANSKNNIGYTPDGLIINNIYYDISGDIDYEEKRLNCRVKGDLLVDKNEDYVYLNEEEEEKLLKLLNSKDTEFIVTIFPTIENEDDIELVRKDILTECEGEIFIYLLGKEIQKKFSFKTECYL